MQELKVERLRERIPQKDGTSNATERNKNPNERARRLGGSNREQARSLANRPIRKLAGRRGKEIQTPETYLHSLATTIRGKKTRKRTPSTQL
jgi:hypothetical protein